MKFRNPREEDQGEILNLVKRVLKDYGLDIDPSETDRDLSDTAHYYFKRNGLFEIIDEDGEIVGSYGVYPVSPDVCELRKMYLLPGFQGRGLGKLMMERAISKSKELGYATMLLETNKKLEKAVRLYEKYGFVEYTPAHLSDSCDLAMRRDL